MVGFCAAIGEVELPVERVAPPLCWRGHEETTNHVEDGFALLAVEHPGGAGGHAVCVDGDPVWVTGQIHGFDGPGGYENRHDLDPRPSSTAYCARLYREHGLSFAEGVNGTFAAVIGQPAGGEVAIVTDRMNTRPVYYARVDGGMLVSTHVQALARHPAFEPAFDLAALYEYATDNRVAGVKTPVADVREFPPGAVARIDLETAATEVERYWRLRYRPVDKSFSWFAERFLDLVTRVIEERVTDDRRYGLLLSGGSDSRLVGSVAGSEVTAYHMSGWMNREARTAERVALTTGADFRFLRRDADHHRRMYGTAPPLMNFNGRFDQAHLNGFHERVNDEVDVLLSGLYGDTFYKGNVVPTYEVSIGGLGTIELPFHRRIASTGAYVEDAYEPAPPFLRTPPGMREILARSIETDVDGPRVGGVDYPSLGDLVLFGDFYPLSNDSDFHYFGLTQMTRHWTPFLDNRLLDLALRMPVGHMLRRDVVDAALSERDPALASIPHAETGVPPSESFPRRYPRKYATLFVREHVLDDPAPVPDLGQGPWRNRADIVREDFFEEALYESEDLARRLPFLDWGAVTRCYREHLGGEDHTAALCTLLTLLGMPLVERIADGDQVATTPDPIARRSS